MRPSLLLLLAGCRLHASPLGAETVEGPRDAAVPLDAAPAEDAAVDAGGSTCTHIPAPLVEWVFDRAADARAPVPDRAETDPYVPLAAADRDPVGVVFRDEGVLLDGGRLEASLEDGQALATAIMRAGSFTIEAWVETERNDQTGPARIVTYSSGAFSRAVSLMQNGTTLETRLRSTATDENGIDLGFVVADVFPASAPRQLVLTFDGETGWARVYLDGELRGEREHQVTGAPATLNWDTDFNRLGCGDEFDTKGDARVWRGTLWAVRIWSAALDDVQVACRLDARP